MPHAETLTADQQNSLELRAASDATLIEGGATYDEYDGQARLNPTYDQKYGIFHSEVLQPFLESTPEGQKIVHHDEELDKFQNALGIVIGRAVKREEKRGRYVWPNPRDSQAYLEENKLPVDFTHLDPEPKERRLPFLPGSAAADRYSLESRDYANDLSRRTTDLRQRLASLARDLISFPQYRIGTEVSVTRSARDGQPERVESGWKIVDITAKGLQVTNQDGSLVKPVTIPELNAANGITNPRDSLQS